MAAIRYDEGGGEHPPAVTGSVRHSLRIGNCSGCYGDRFSAAREMLEGGPIDVLTGEYLAELTMLILWKARVKDPNAGYATTFLRQMEDVAGLAIDRVVKIVVSAGGLNPAGLAIKLRELLKRLGLRASVAHIEGDDLLPRVGELQAAGHELRHLDTGRSLAEAGVEPVSANVYLGAWGIVEALNAGADIVVCPRVTDASLVGEPAPDTLKVSINYVGGYRNTMTFVITGLEVEAKAEIARRQLFESLGGEAAFDHVDVQLLRTDRPDAASNAEAVAQLRVTVKDRDAKKVGRAFSNRFIELALSSYPGFFTTTPPEAETAYGVYWPALVPAGLVTQPVVLEDGRRLAVIEPPRRPPEGEESDPRGAERIDLGPTRRLALGTVFGARSCDKGGNANIGVWARSDDGYRWLEAFLTVERLKELLPETAELQVQRYALPNIRSLNFVVIGLLGEGVASSTRIDPQAKGLGEYLRSRTVELPESLLEDVPGA